MKDLTVQDAGMHHTNMVSDVLEGIQEVLYQEQAPIETSVTVHEPHKHV